MKTALRPLRQLLRRAGLDLVRYQPRPPEPEFPPDFDPATIETIRAVRPYTRTTPERIAALCDAVRYVVESRVEGAIVECGVWRGGSMMAAARTLKQGGDEQRDLFLFDTYEGMVAPGEQDVSFKGVAASTLMGQSSRNDEGSVWCYASLADVRAAMEQTGYPMERVHFVVGRVEETIPAQAPETIALLRLDTDWYESTRHELLHLFPRLSEGAVILVDDYGHWQGARQAVDEYIAQHGVSILLNRIDYTGRIGIVQRPRRPLNDKPSLQPEMAS